MREQLKQDVNKDIKRFISPLEVSKKQLRQDVNKKNRKKLCNQLMAITKMTNIYNLYLVTDFALQTSNEILNSKWFFSYKN